MRSTTSIAEANARIDAGGGGRTRREWDDGSYARSGLLAIAEGLWLVRGLAVLRRSTDAKNSHWSV